MSHIAKPPPRWIYLALGIALSAVLSAPLWLSSAFWLSFLAQSAIMIVLCCSYQLLYGQAGMLSFGHAVYSGLAAFVCLHLLNRWSDLAIVYLPLFAALAAAGFALLVGCFSCRSSPTVFSMISLALAELLTASALMLPGFFGGEAGISANRVRAEGWLGWNFASQSQMLGLLLGWCGIAVLAMYGWQKTPLGRLANAVRENSERLAFLGFNPQWVRILSLVSAAFFAGIGGAMAALQFEIVSAEHLSVQRSGLILLFTVIGGSRHFSGALLGALTGVFFSSVLSDWTPAWPLYLGLFFVVLVRFVPDGLLGCLALLKAFFQHARDLKAGLRWQFMALQLTRSLSSFCAMIFSIEFIYQRNLQATPLWQCGPLLWDTSQWQSWLWPATAGLLGLVSHLILRKPGAAWAKLNSRSSSISSSRSSLQRGQHESD